MAARHDVWVLTRESNRAAIEQALAERPVPGLSFLYYDPPELFSWGRRGGWRMQLHYYCWQLLSARPARQAHRRLRFDVAHHVTFAKYWAPSGLAGLNIPFVWGPVGGGEKTPRPLLSLLTRNERLLERLKAAASRAAEFDPMVRRTARRASIALASTQESAVRLKKLRCRRVEILTQAGIDRAGGRGESEAGRPVRFISIGRLVHWKGFLLGLHAFAKSGCRDAEYWIVGDGPARPQLELFAKEHGLCGRVRFFGALPFDETARLLSSADVLVHPSFHDSAGMVCLEAMAAGMPVLCLNTGGPAVLADGACGVLADPSDPERACGQLAEAMLRLAENDAFRLNMGRAARERVLHCFTWAKKAEWFSRFYDELSEGGVID